MWDFGLPVDRKCKVRSTGPRQKKKKIKAVQRLGGTFWPPSGPWTAPNPQGTSQTLVEAILHLFKPFLVRESRERSGTSWLQTRSVGAGRRDFSFGPLFSPIFKVGFWEVLMYSPIFTYGETENVKKWFYFTKEGWVFEVSKRLFISDCKTDFYPKMFWTILEAVGLQIKHGLSFWKSLDV